MPSGGYDYSGISGPADAQEAENERNSGPVSSGSSSGGSSSSSSASSSSGSSGSSSTGPRSPSQDTSGPNDDVHYSGVTGPEDADEVGVSKDKVQGNTNEGIADYLAGSVDESVARQFDDKPGGGFADEVKRVVDPTQSASPETERDIQAASVLHPIIPTSLGAGSYATGAGEGDGGSDRPNSPVDRGAEVVEDSPAGPAVDSGSGSASGVVQDPVGTAQEAAENAAPNVNVDLPEGPSIPSWLDEAAIGGAGLLLLGAFLYLARPLFQIGANVSE